MGVFVSLRWHKKLDFLQSKIFSQHFNFQEMMVILPCPQNMLSSLSEQQTDTVYNYNSTQIYFSVIFPFMPVVDVA